MAASMFAMTKRRVFRGMGDLANQLQRATLSISNNIAEGFERGSTNELIHFLYVARGSAGEVRSMLCVMVRMPEFVDLKTEILDLQARGESVSRQLRSWANSLQNSEITGQRHLNDKSREAYQQKQRRSALESSRKQFMEAKEQELRQQAQSRFAQQQAMQESRDEASESEPEES